VGSRWSKLRRVGFLWRARVKGRPDKVEGWSGPARTSSRVGMERETAPEATGGHRQPTNARGARHAGRSFRSTRNGPVKVSGAPPHGSRFKGLHELRGAGSGDPSAGREFPAGERWQASDGNHDDRRPLAGRHPWSLSERNVRPASCSPQLPSGAKMTVSPAGDACCAGLGIFISKRQVIRLPIDRQGRLSSERPAEVLAWPDFAAPALDHGGRHRRTPAAK